MGLLTPVEQEAQKTFGMVPMEERLSILPRYSSTQGLIAPQFIYDLAKAFVSPYVAMQGRQVTPEESLNVALSAMGGSSIGSAPKGALRSGFSKNKGNVNPIEGTWYKGMYPYDYTKEVRATVPNLPQWKQEVIDTGPLIDPKDIGRTTPFPSFSSLPDLEGILGFFAKSPKVASQFAPVESGAVYPVNITANRVFTMDAKGRRAGELQFGDKSTKFRNAVNSGKYDAILIKNTSDEGDIAIALKNAKIKSIFEK